MTYFIYLEQVNTSKYAREYMSVIFAGAWFNLPGFALNSAIRAEGNPKLAAKMMIISCILNLILDPIFIFGFGMGIKRSSCRNCNMPISSMSLVYTLFYSRKIEFKIKSKEYKIR